jgi:hypothetical protein
MKQVLKRPGDAYLLSVFWGIIMGLWLIMGGDEWRIWFAAAGLGYAIINLSYLIVRRNSMEIVDHELTLYASNKRKHAHISCNS